MAGRSDCGLHTLAKAWLVRAGEGRGAGSGAARFAASAPRREAHYGLLKGVVDTDPGGASQNSGAGALRRPASLAERERR